VVLRWSAYGTHRGVFLGVSPTNKEVVIKGIEILRLLDNKIVERWGMYNDLALIQQLGAHVENQHTDTK
jgi:predicted ester cyclase